MDDFLAEVGKVATMDNALKSLGELALWLRTYYHELRDRGFTDAQAMKLVEQVNATYWLSVFAKGANRETL